MYIYIHTQRDVDYQLMWSDTQGRTLLTFDLGYLAIQEKHRGAKRLITRGWVWLRWIGVGSEGVLMFWNCSCYTIGHAFSEGPGGVGVALQRDVN